jgi:putative intracellular protease/amidase
MQAIRQWAAQCHGADTGLTAQCRTVAGMASPGGLVKQRRDMIPRRCQRDFMARIRL